MKQGSISGVNLGTLTSLTSGVPLGVGSGQLSRLVGTSSVHFAVAGRITQRSKSGFKYHLL